MVKLTDVEDVTNDLIGREEGEGAEIIVVGRDVGRRRRRVENFAVGDHHLGVSRGGQHGGAHGNAVGIGLYAGRERQREAGVALKLRVVAAAGRTNPGRQRATVVRGNPCGRQVGEARSCDINCQGRVHPTGRVGPDAPLNHSDIDRRGQEWET